MRGRFLGILVGLLAFAQGFAPKDALSYRPPEAALQSRRLALAKTQLSLAKLGLAGRAQLRYGDELTASAGIALDLGEEKRLAAEKAVIEAEARLRAAIRDGVYRALKAHAALWRAEAGLRAARLAVALAELKQQAAAAKGAGPLALEDARNALEDARIALAEARLEAEAAAAEARALGLVGPAEPATLAFALPPARADRAARLALALAEARAARARRDLLVLSADLAYQEAVALDLKAETAGPSLGLEVGPKNPLAKSGAWRVALAARLSLDPAAWTAVRDAELAAQATRLQNQEAERRRTRRLAEARTRVRLAERRLRLAERRRGLATSRQRSARLRRERGVGSALDLAAARLEAARAEAEQARAWGAYLDAVKAYLDLADGEWRVR